MSESAEAVAQAFVRAINRQDANALAELMTEEHQFVDSLGRLSRPGSDASGLEELFQHGPDYRIAVDETYCDGPVVVMLGRAQGTYAADGLATAENRWKTPVALERG